MKVHHSECRDKQEFIILALVIEAEVAANNHVFATIYRATKEFALGPRFFNGSLKDVNGKVLIHDEDHIKSHIKRWKEKNVTPGAPRYNFVGN